jgi:hypothetical protein
LAGDRLYGVPRMLDILIALERYGHKGNLSRGCS